MIPINSVIIIGIKFIAYALLYVLSDFLKTPTVLSFLINYFLIIHSSILYN